MDRRIGSPGQSATKTTQNALNPISIKRLFAITVILMLVFCETIRYTGNNFEAEASDPGDDISDLFSLTEDELDDLGYQTILTLPVAVPLSYDSENNRYQGTDNGIYVTGIVPNGKKVTCGIAEQSTTLTGPLSDTYTIPYGTKGYRASLSKSEWTQAEANNNLKAVEGTEGKTEEDLIKSTLSVAIDAHSFIPRNTGEYQFPVQVRVAFVNVE